MRCRQENTAAWSLVVPSLECNDALENWLPWIPSHLSKTSADKQQEKKTHAGTFHRSVPHVDSTSLDQTNMDGSILARLSGELRNQIYLSYFERDKLLEIEIEIDVDGPRPIVKAHPLALLKTCR